MKLKGARRAARIDARIQTPARPQKKLADLNGKVKD